MKTITSIMMFLLVFVGVAYAGNFGEFNSLAINRFALIPGPEYQGFKMYKSGGGSVIIGALVKKDFVIDAYVLCDCTITVDDLVNSVSFLYSVIQDTRRQIFKHKDAELIIDGGTKLWKNRATKIIISSYNQLYHTNKTTFDFDNIKIKALDLGEIKWNVEDKNETKGHQKKIAIKLWVE